MNMSRSLHRLIIIGWLLLACARPAVASAEADALHRTIPAWPIVYYRAEGDVVKTDILFSLIYYERQKSLIRYSLRPFLFSTEGDPEKDYRKTSLLWSLAAYTRTGPDLNFHLFPLYWYGRTPTSSYQILAPLYWSRHSSNASHTVFFPLYWQGDNGPDSYLHLWPFFGMNRRGDDFVRYSTLYPLFQYSLDRTREETTVTAFWPLYRLSFNPQGVSHYLFPLYWYRYDADRSTGLVLTYYWHDEPTRTARALFPLWYRLRGERTAADLLVPFYYRRVERDSRLMMVTPFYLQRTTPDSRLDLIFPLFARYHTPNGSVMFIIPTWLSSTNEHGHFSMLLPLYLHSRTNDSSLLLTPLYISSVTPQTATRMVLPVFFDSRSGQAATRMILPFYLSVRSEQSRLRFITPLFLHYRTADSLLQLGLPIYLRFEAGPSSFTTLFPLYFHARDDTQHSATTYYFPFYGHYQRGDAVSRHFLLFPLYSQLRDDGLQLHAWDILWPLWHYETTPTTTAFRLLPLFWHTRTPDSRTTIGFPLYWSFASGDRSTWHLVPLYGVHTRGDWYAKRFILGPTMMTTRDDRADLHRWDLLFGLSSFMRQGETTRDWIFPLYYHRHDPSSNTTVGFPLYWSFRGGDRLSFHLIPFYGVRTVGDRYTQRYVLGPLFIQTRDADRSLSRIDLLFPFVRWETGKDSATAWVLPLFYRRHDPSSHTTIGFPLYWSLASGNDSSLFLFPVYGQFRHGSYREYAPLWPLFRFGSDPVNQTSTIQALLFYHQREPADTVTTFFPLWWHVTTPRSITDGSLLLHAYEHDTGTNTTRLSLLGLMPLPVSLVRFEQSPSLHKQLVFPLYSYERNDQTDTLHWSVLWPLFSYSSRGETARQSAFLWQLFTYERKDAQTSDFRLLWRFIRHEKTATSSTYEFNPLFYYETNEEHGSFWAILGGLIGRETSPDGKSRMRWLWVF
jgi:hypothetical protein